jgi:hypothetical protein
MQGNRDRGPSKEKCDDFKEYGIIFILSFRPIEPIDLFTPQNCSFTSSLCSRIYSGLTLSIFSTSIPQTMKGSSVS